METSPALPGLRESCFKGAEALLQFPGWRKAPSSSESLAHLFLTAEGVQPRLGQAAGMVRHRRCRSLEGFPVMQNQWRPLHKLSSSAWDETGGGTGWGIFLWRLLQTKDASLLAAKQGRGTDTSAQSQCQHREQNQHQLSARRHQFGDLPPIRSVFWLLLSLHIFTEISKVWKPEAMFTILLNCALLSPAPFHSSHHLAKSPRF